MSDDFRAPRPELRPAVPRAEAPASPVSPQLGLPPEPRVWRIQPVTIAWKAGLAVIFVLASLFFTEDVTKFGAALIAAALMAALTLRDVLLRVRLTADSSAVTAVSGFTRKRLSWSEVERVRVDARSRLGIRSELLEIDTGVDLYMFSATELGAPVAEVADELNRLRTGREDQKDKS